MRSTLAPASCEATVRAPGDARSQHIQRYRRGELARRLLLLPVVGVSRLTSDTGWANPAGAADGHESYAIQRRTVMCRLTICVHVGNTIAWFVDTAMWLMWPVFPCMNTTAWYAIQGNAPLGTNDAMEGGSPWRRTWVKPQDFPKLAWPSHRDVHQRGAVTT